MLFTNKRKKIRFCTTFQTFLNLTFTDKTKTENCALYSNEQIVRQDIDQRNTQLFLGVTLLFSQKGQA